MTTPIQIDGPFRRTTNTAVRGLALALVAVLIVVSGFLLGYWIGT